MLDTLTYAAASGAAAGGAAGFFVSVFPLILIFVIFYFLLIRPQQRRVKQHQQMIGALKVRDTVVTGGGLIGRVTKVEDAEVEVELAPNVRVKVVKGTLAEVRPHGAKPAND